MIRTDSPFCHRFEGDGEASDVKEIEVISDWMKESGDEEGYESDLDTVTHRGKLSGLARTLAPRSLELLETSLQRRQQGPDSAKVDEECRNAEVGRDF